MAGQQFGRFAGRGARRLARRSMRDVRRGGRSRSSRSSSRRPATGRRGPIRAGRGGIRGANGPVMLWMAILIGILLVFGVLIEVLGLSDDADGADAAEDAVVERIVDGDTLVVTLDGEQERVRLLNIDTPETVHPDRPVECLGPEASAHMEELVSAGDEVRLEFDRERTDQYDRLLAGVYRGDTFLNAEMARAGFGAPVHYEPNARFLEEIEQAWEQAERQGAGVFADDLDCTPAIP